MPGLPGAWSHLVGSSGMLDATRGNGGPTLESWMTSLP